MSQPDPDRSAPGDDRRLDPGPRQGVGPADPESSGRGQAAGGRLRPLIYGSVLGLLAEAYP